MGPRTRQFLTVALLATGALLWDWLEGRAAALHGHGLGPMRGLLIAAAALLSLVPPLRRGVTRTLDRIRVPCPRALEWATFGISAAATCYFVFTAFNQDRDLFPKTHDEGSYVIGLRMLARGRLWMPRHELADFFDTFYVITRPVYASLYFPGTALLYVPTDWLQWPTWVMPAIASGAVVGLLYRVITELIDGAAGALAALLLVSLSWYRMLTVLVFSQVPLLLMALLLVWAWLRWRRGGGVGWALAVGAFAGWAAIIRPIDALCYALPLGAAMVYDLRSRPPRQRLLHPALVIVGAMPFLFLQLVFNKGVTGRITQTPYTYYLERDQPRTSLGFHAYDASIEPSSTLPQKRDYYRTFMARYIREHQPGTFFRVWAEKSLPMLFDTTLPARFLIVMVPISVTRLTDVRRRVLWATLPLFMIGYALNTFFLEHYAAAVIPAVILSALLGLHALADAWPRWRDHVVAAGVLVLVTTSVLSLYELNPVATALDPPEKRHLHAIDDETFRSPTLQFVRFHEHNVQRPAVILFTYSPGVNIIEEPVYNTDVASPDDAPVIRAHDLGERNREIFAYYARIQPDRTFYRFDRATGKLSGPLGTAKSLAATRPVLDR
jgi:4-amino-4-deoxy-L-arabinose transferase-like glycosyltransferase